MNTRRLVSLAFLTALAVALHYLESLIPFTFVPGYKLGLANIVSMFALFYYDVPSYLFVTVTRVILVALISSGFGVSFMMSLGGALLSIVGSLLIYYLLKGSVYSVSAISGMCHAIGQLLVYAIVYETPYIFMYIVFFGPFSILTAVLLAVIVSILIKRLPKSFKNEEKRRRV